MNNTEQNKKEAGLTERFSTKTNFILPREFAIYPFFSGEKSDELTKREVSLSDFGNKISYEIHGPTLNKFDFGVLLSVLKLIDNQTYHMDSQRQEFSVEYKDLFDLLCLPRNDRHIGMKENIFSSLRRIKQLTITIKKQRFGGVVFNMLDEIEAGEDFAEKNESINLVVSQRFIDFFRESTQQFIVHIDHKKFHSLKLDAARLYLFLKANKNVRFINRNELDAIFQLTNVAERDANKRFKASTEMLELDVKFEKKNRRTSKLTFKKYPNL